MYYKINHDDKLNDKDTAQKQKVYRYKQYRKLNVISKGTERFQYRPNVHKYT